MKKIIQITDTHLFPSSHQLLNWVKGHEVSSNQQLTHLLSYIDEKEKDIDYFIFTGDVVQQCCVESYQAFNHIVKSINHHLAVIPGNHDDHALLKQSITHNYFTTHDELCLNDWLIIPLDTSVNGQAGGHLSVQQLDQLAKKLKKNPHKPTMIVMHHHPILINSSWIDRHILDNGECLLALLKHHTQVKGVVFGHIHHAYPSSNPLPQVPAYHFQLLGTPSTCVQFKPNRPTAELDHTSPAYRVLELHNNGHLTTYLNYLS